MVCGAECYFMGAPGSARFRRAKVPNLEKKEFLGDFIESVEIYSEKLDNGYIILQFIVGPDGSTLNEVLSIEGQRRLTTVYILLKALYDTAKGFCCKSLRRGTIDKRAEQSIVRVRKMDGKISQKSLIKHW